MRTIGDTNNQWTTVIWRLTFWNKGSAMLTYSDANLHVYSYIVNILYTYLSWYYLYKVLLLVCHTKHRGTQISNTISHTHIHSHVSQIHYSHMDIVYIRGTQRRLFCLCTCFIGQAVKKMTKYLFWYASQIVLRKFSNKPNLRLKIWIYPLLSLCISVLIICSDF